MGHYTGKKSTPISNDWNKSTYFQIIKFHHKVADVIIKPEFGDGLNLKNFMFF